MKRMNFLASNGDRRSAKRLITELTPVVDGLPLGHQRVFRYNVACAELALGDPDAASKRVQQVIREYYELIGLTPAKVLGNNAPELARMINELRSCFRTLGYFTPVHERGTEARPNATRTNGCFWPASRTPPPGWILKITAGCRRKMQAPFWPFGRTCFRRRLRRNRAGQGAGGAGVIW